jgi:hypothetical protein
MDPDAPGGGPGAMPGEPGAGDPNEPTADDGAPTAGDGAPAAGDGAPAAPGNDPASPGVVDPADPTAEPIAGEPAAAAPPAAAGVTECLDAELIGPTPIRRISTSEYANSVRDVFQAVINTGQLPADEKLGIFKTNVATRLTADHFERYRTLATSVSADVLASFGTLSGCSSTADAACVGAYLDGAARQLFHGTLEAADSARIQDIYTSLSTEADADIAVLTAVQWILLSPRFLFVVEFGEPASATRSLLTGSEVAGRLAAFFWRTVPDAALLAAADEGGLATPEAIRARADAMLSDPRAVPILEDFGAQLLRIVPPGPDADALEQQKKAQVGEILAKASTDAALTYADLLTGSHPPAGAELAGFYGAEDRRGILLTAGFLASNSTGEVPSPVKRGYIIRKALYCTEVPAPSDPTDMQLSDEVGANNKEVFNAHSNNPTCWGCHALMDPIGDAFGQYTATGGFDAALAEDTSGTLTPSQTDTSGDFQNVDELLTKMAADPTAAQCFALQASRFALGRNETVEDACGIEQITEAFAASSYSVRELLLNIATSSMFANRDAVVAGGTCR